MSFKARDVLPRAVQHFLDQQVRRGELLMEKHFIRRVHMGRGEVLYDIAKVSVGAGESEQEIEAGGPHTAQAVEIATEHPEARFQAKPEKRLPETAVEIEVREPQEAKGDAQQTRDEHAGIAQKKLTWAGAGS